MRIVVIGGGPSGMMAAITAAANGAETVLIEKNSKLGKKLFITGKGRCNLTNNCAPDEFLKNVVTNHKFLYSAVYSFTPADCMEFFQDNGLKLVTERGNRVFPESNKSSDVLKVLEKLLKQNKVDIKLDTQVIEITKNSSGYTVVTDNEQIDCNSVVVATGGITYAATGSTGDGYKFAKQLGHKIVKPVAALSALKTVMGKTSQLQGLTLKNVGVSVRKGDKLLASQFGELLFTHFGVSGPTVLSLSSFINREDMNNLYLYIDLKPALSVQQLDNRLLRDFSENINKNLKNSLDDLLPKSMISIIIENSKVNPDIKINQITAVQRQSLVDNIKNFTMKIVSLAETDQAIVTSGGVDVSDINPKTMESKLHKKLFFAGEVMDVDALTGGFNIQIALSSGYLAGKNAAYGD